MASDENNGNDQEITDEQIMQVLRGEEEWFRRMTGTEPRHRTLADVIRYPEPGQRKPADVIPFPTQKRLK